MLHARGGGGGYGGKGGSGAYWWAKELNPSGKPTQGATYGNKTQPTHVGSGGRHEKEAGSGGGALWIEVKNEMLLGHGVVVSACGGRGQANCGVGSGGSVFIKVGGCVVVNGAVLLAADGGPGGLQAGGGGGGRICLLVLFLCASTCHGSNRGEWPEPRR